MRDELVRKQDRTKGGGRRWSRRRRLVGVAAVALLGVVGCTDDDGVGEIESDVPNEPAREDPGQGLVPEVDTNGSSNDGLGLDGEEVEPTEGVAD